MKIKQTCNGNNNIQCSGSIISGGDSHVNDGIQSTGVSISGKKCTVDGKIVPFKEGMKGKSITTINGKIFIDGYEYVNGEWKMTLRALLHKYF